MKKTLLLLSIVFVQSISFAQNENINFNTPLHQNQDWSASHGSPTWSGTGIIVWNDVVSKSSQGEGANYTGYNFEKGKAYRISVSLLPTTRSGHKPKAAQMNILLTENEITGQVTESSGKPAPKTPENHLTLMNENIWTSIDKSITYELKFVADRDYENVWFYPEMTPGDNNNKEPLKNKNSQQVEVIISDLIIYDLGQASDSLAANLVSRQ